VPMLKVYDCSNSPERPPHRGGGGPVENGMVSLLKKYARHYDAAFVDKPTEADVIFTNDVFPQDVLKLNLPRVKRMDGVFWQEALRERNIPYVEAANKADAVIFISEYSRQSFLRHYSASPGVSHVVRSWVDPNVFYPGEGVMSDKPLMAVACASSWDRPEKRLDAILRFVELTGVHVNLVGRISTKPSNRKAWALGEMNPTDLAKTLHISDFFLNFSYRDAGPKVVAEACACGLPVLYADSGGTKEMVTVGVPIEDDAPWEFEEKTPPLNEPGMEKAWSWLKERWEEVSSLAFRGACDGGKNVDFCLRGYFDVFKSAVGR